MVDHQHGYPDNEQEWLEMLTNKGKGDPDAHGHYPGQEPEQAACQLCNPKAESQNIDTSELTNQK